MPGIKSTKIGHLGGQEVVTVEYDPEQTNLKKMSDTLKRQGSFNSLVVKDRESALDAGGSLNRSEIQINSANPRFIESKYSLRSQHPELYRLDLTEDQKRILNSWSYFGGPRPDVLTEQQNRILTEQEKESMPLRVLKWLRSQ
ncbi:MAG: hypothetical protein ACE1ZE_02160 [Candidatus Binatia bacterium]